jgi:hypothetical protein
MKTHSRLGQLIVAFTAAAGLAMSLVACDSTRARSPLDPSFAPAGTSSANSQADDHQLLAAIQRATAKYQNIDAAFADGYIDDGYGCIDSSVIALDGSVGGMGFHLINWDLHNDPATDPLRPDLLVYEPARSPNGKPKLVAFEYEVFKADWTAAGNTEPPSLLGHEFEYIDFDGLQVYGLHIWLWLNNPLGMFTDFNPKTSCR